MVSKVPMRNLDSSETLARYQTRESLLLRLKDKADEYAWREFHAIYGRLIFGYSLHYGIGYAEAEDIVQEVCIKVFRQILQFDYAPERGRFRGWLKTITRNTVVDYLRRRRSRTNTSREFRELSELEAESSAEADEELWRMEWRKALYETAMERVRKRVGEQTFRIFNEHVLGQRPADELADDTSMDVGSIYSVKHRVLKYIKQEVKNILENE
ncbi:ECF RNA polymerase sigma factor RpoE [Pontiella desulfatans]|uniref:ECF RNA polymerase sigma factor RpoE n=1 Tax=Pontiella desulfatans TaxID=2750659 RepID=A0A6C2TWM2_PONDE|nr:sigma-70 family RNA polymerase sigma factor [Pontiella desulfatans]VGO12080.1 ECF RNA polymerase sigma factor RpoE [Pontiella desulfatans]